MSIRTLASSPKVPLPNAPELSAVVLLLVVVPLLAAGVLQIEDWLDSGCSGGVGEPSDEGAVGFSGNKTGTEAGSLSAKGT